MKISGETLPFVEALEFNSKRQLLDGINAIKKTAEKLTEPDRTIVMEMTAAGIAEIENCAESGLLEFKRYLANRRKIF